MQVKLESTSFDDLYMTMAFLVSMKSKDPRTKIGAVIVGPENEVISTGYNGFPRGCKDHLDNIIIGVPDENNLTGTNFVHVNRMERPEKYNFFEHAERNAIYNAARIGVSTKSSTMYTNGTPCIDCARAVIQGGIKRLVVSRKLDLIMFKNPKWRESIARSNFLLSECGVVVNNWDGKILDVKVMTDGVEYDRDWNGQGVLI